MARLPQSALHRGGGDESPERRDEQSQRNRDHGSSRTDGCGELHPQLARAIQIDVVPQMLREHRQTVAPSFRRIGVADVNAFAQITLTGDLAKAGDFVEALRLESVTLEAVYLELLEPAARRLGVLWEADQCDFTEVTMGLGRMQQVLRDLSDEFRNEAECVANGKRLLLIPAPGGQHTLGLFIVADFFARAGWDVWGGAVSPHRDICALVREEWFDVVGLSVGCATQMEVLAAAISAMRAASRNPLVGIMVGGPMFTANPACVAQVGADAMAANGLQAPDAAMALVLRRSVQN